MQLLVAAVFSGLRRRAKVLAPEAMTPEPIVLCGYTDSELACFHVAGIVLLLVGGFLLGMPATTTKKLAESKAGKHPAWWWPVVDVWCRSVEWANRTLSYEIGAPLIKAKFVIDTMKGLTPLVITALMVQHENWSVGACTYLALHGSYGALWVLKSQIFPDPRWETKLTATGVLVCGTWMALYWSGGASLIILRTPVSNERAALATVMYVLGVVLMLGADGQRFFVCQLKKGLISDGWYARTRNPNYLGEMLLYASFAVLGQTTFMWTHLLLTWSTTFLPNMWWKERSLMRKPGWAAWAARSGFLLPVLLPGGPAATAATARPTASPTAKRAKASPKRAPSSKR